MRASAPLDREMRGKCGDRNAGTDGTFTDILFRGLSSGTTGNVPSVPGVPSPVSPGVLGVPGARRQVRHRMPHASGIKGLHFYAVLQKVNSLRFTRLGGREDRAEFASSKALEGAEALGQFDSGQAVLAVQPAKEVLGGALALPGVAFNAAGDEVAVGVALTLRLRHNMIEATPSAADAVQAVKAGTAFASVDGLTQGRGFQEIDLYRGLLGEGGGRGRRPPSSSDGRREFLRGGAHGRCGPPCCVRATSIRL